MLYSCFIVSQDLILLKNNCSDAARLIARDQSNCFFFCTHVVRCVLASLIRANVRLERTTRPFKMAFCVLLGSPLCFPFSMPQITGLFCTRLSDAVQRGKNAFRNGPTFLPPSGWSPGMGRPPHFVAFD
jgi:hypothetical protein